MECSGQFFLQLLQWFMGVQWKLLVLSKKLQIFLSQKQKQILKYKKNFLFLVNTLLKIKAKVAIKIVSNDPDLK